jgi:hypothetical protein
MNAQSSEHPISVPERSAPRLSRALSHAMASRLEVKAAVASVLRERRRYATVRSAPDGVGDQGAIEVEVISLLYGDAAMRHRAFDTQPSHIWPASRGRAAPGRK